MRMPPVFALSLTGFGSINMSMSRSRPLPPHLPPLVEQVRLRELKAPALEASVASPGIDRRDPASTLTLETPRLETPRSPVHPLLEQVADIEALAAVLLSALEQESAQTAHHHTRIAKQIVRSTHALRQDLNRLLSDRPPSSDPLTVEPSSLERVGH